jgi:PmbA protein
VTGDYSRGAGGYWVENGEIALPGRGADDRRQPAQMLQDIVGVGADAYTTGADRRLGADRAHEAGRA